MRPIAVFRFSPTEGPAHFAEWLDRESLPWELIAVDQRASVPEDARRYSGIGMMGGPMSVYEALDWIEPVSRLLRDAVARAVPVLGHCLGGQLLAQALGARVRRTAVPEIGWIDVESTDVDAQNAWFGGRSRFTPFQWHYDVFDVPAGATRVLKNHFNANQGYVINDRHIGFQCHIEMTRELVETWCASSTAELPTRSNAHLQTAADLLADLPARIAALNQVADGVYARWSQGLKR